MNTMKKIVSVGEFLVGISAVLGGYKLITTNGMGMPMSLLNNSPFSSYIWPGVILLFVVGGSYLLSSLLLFRKSRYAYEASATAGFGLLIWIFTELYMMRNPHWLQVLYFGFGILTIIATLLFLKSERKK